MPAPTTTTRSRSGGGVMEATPSYGPSGRGVILGLARERPTGAPVGLHQPPAPPLGRAHLIEREDMEAGDAVVGASDERLDVGHELVRRVAAPPHQPRDEVAVFR